MIAPPWAAMVAAAIVLRLPDNFWQRCGESDTDRLLYAALILMLLRDAYGCFFLNLTRRPARSIRKPLGYDAAVLRRPRWCPVPLLLRLCAKDAAARVRHSPGRRGCVRLGADRLRVVVALAYAIVELRFHAALGWHRDVLLLNTLFASALPEPCRATGRALALCHAYGGSGLRRLWTGGAFDGDALREVLRGARNGVVPKLTASAAKAPPRLLAVADAGARVGLELVGVGLLLAYLDDTRVRLTFRACAIAFHLESPSAHGRSISSRTALSCSWD